MQSYSLMCNFAHIIRINISTTMARQFSKRYLILAAVCVIALLGLTYYYFFTSFTGRSVTKYVYVDQDDNYDSLAMKLRPEAKAHCFQAFSILARHSNLINKVRTGRYALTPSMGAFTVFRHLKNGLQDPLNLVVPSVRTMQDMAGALSKKLMLDSLTIENALTDNAECAKFGYDTTTVAAMFIPNTYDIYWDTNVDNLLKRIKKENDSFWDQEERKEKAKSLNLSPVQVATLASIVDEETANDKEKPMIAGMYYNRLMLRDAEYPQGMPLQADPTIKFALKDFALKRIYQNMLFIKSPYNTYKNPGLPPGPIRVASIAGIDAVLNMVHHNYLYMCAKPDFSGTHDFAVTYAEHMANAHRYAAALNQRGIK